MIFELLFIILLAMIIGGIIHFCKKTNEANLKEKAFEYLEDTFEDKYRVVAGKKAEDEIFGFYDKSTTKLLMAIKYIKGGKFKVLGLGESEGQELYTKEQVAERLFSYESEKYEDFPAVIPLQDIIAGREGY